MKTKLTKARFLLGNRLLLLLMRTFIFLCCLTVFGFTPNDLVSQKSSIKIDLDGAMTVDEIFDLIMNQTDYSFIYEVGMFDDYPTIPVKKGRISTNRLLKKSLEPGNLDVVFLGKFHKVIGEFWVILGPYSEILTSFLWGGIQLGCSSLIQPHL